MRGPERRPAWRVVADPGALDALDAPGGDVLRLAPDDALVLDADRTPSVADRHAIAVPEHGFVGWELDGAELEALLRRHVEWRPAPGRPAVAQGLVAGVPAKLWLREDGSALLLCSAAYAAELEERIS